MDLAILIVQMLAALLPQLVGIWKDHLSGQKTAEEARAAAEAAFAAAWALLIDPKKDAAATDAAADAAARKKFEGA